MLRVYEYCLTFVRQKIIRLFYICQVGVFVVFLLRGESLS